VLGFGGTFSVKMLIPLSVTKKRQLIIKCLDLGVVELVLREILDCGTK